jgi:hypothetical protein
MGGNVGLGTTSPRARLEVAGNPDQHGTAFFVADPSKGPNISHVHWDPTGDWYIRSAASDGKVIVQDSGGNVGIGTSSPQNTLHVAKDGHLNAIFDFTGNQEHLTLVVGTAGSGLRFSETNEFFIASQPYANRNDQGFGNEHLRITAAGYVGIGTSTPSVKLDVVGDMHLNGNAFHDTVGIWTTSDREEKHDIGPIHQPLERLLALQGVRFAWKDPSKHGGSPGHHLGFVAQDVEAIFPEWVKQTPWSTKAVNVGGLNALLVEALRELNAKCDRLRDELGKLNDQIGGAHQAAVPKAADDKPRPDRRSPKR